MNPIIRPETPADTAVISHLTREAFTGDPHSNGNESRIIELLRGSGGLTVSLVAEAKGRVIGHAAASPVTLSDGTMDWFGIGPVSVRPEHQRCGIGTILMQGLLDQLRANNAAGCVVLGDPAFYRRFGFQSHPGLILPGVPPEYFQALLYRGRVPQGTVAYHQAFQS